MKEKKIKLYHFFFVLAVLNLVVFYNYFGFSMIENKMEENILNDPVFNYFICITILIFIIWVSYWFCRRYLTQNNLLIIHLIVTSFCVMIPPILYQSLGVAPRRYIDQSSDFKNDSFLGHMTSNFLIVGTILFLSEIFLLANVRRKSI